MLLDDREVAIATLRQMGAKRPRSPRPIPWRTTPLSHETEYQRELAAVVGRIAPAFEQLQRELPRLLAAARAARGDSISWRLDAGEGRQLRAYVDAAYRAMMTLISVEEVERIALKHARRAAEFSAQVLQRAARAALGVDIVATTPHLRAILEQHVAEVVAHVLAIPEVVAVDIEKLITRAMTTGRVDDYLSNARLITGITGTQASEIAEAVQRAQEAGALSATLAKELQERFGFAKRRAELIARDQLAKITGQVSAASQRALGITRFTWRSMNDRRVRPEHVLRNGKMYRYDAPPSGELPGVPILCRCYGEPNFDDLLGAIEAKPTPAPAAPPKPKVPRPKKIPKRGTPIPRSQEYAQVDAVSFIRSGRWFVADQGLIRTGTDKILARFGLAKRPPSHRGRKKLLVVERDGNMGNAAAFHTTATSEVTIGETYARRLNVALAQDPTTIGNEYKALRRKVYLSGQEAHRLDELQDQIWSQHVLLHESIHGHGLIGQYTGKGVLVEEVTTEVAARRVGRDMYQLGINDHPSLGIGGGAYSEMVEGVVDDVYRELNAAGLQTTRARAFELLETASIRYKQIKPELIPDPTKRRAKTVRKVTGDEQIEKLVEQVDLTGIAPEKHADVRATLRAKLSDTAARVIR